MRSRLAAGLIALAFPLLGAASPAYADHGGYEGRDDCRDGGGCNNERHENYEGAGCKYVCPTFDKSPVQDSFNPTICVMPGSCASNGDNKQKKGEPEPTMNASLFPPSPAAIRDFVLATFKAGIAMGRLFADTTITFVTDLFVGIA